MSKSQTVISWIKEFSEQGKTRAELIEKIQAEFNTNKSNASVYVSNATKATGISLSKGITNSGDSKTKKDKKSKPEPGVKVSVKLTCMSDVKDYLISLGKTIENEFDGGKVVCDLGEISMAFGDFFVRVPGEVDEEGRQISRVMSPAHLRRYILGDNSKIGKLEIL